MRAGLATRPADRMTRVVMMTTAALTGVVALGVALPLAMSSPIPTAGHGNWIVQAAITPPSAAPDEPAVAQPAQAAQNSAETSIEKTDAPTRSLVLVTPPPKPAPVKTRPAARNEFAARWKATGIPASDQADEQPTGTVRFALAAESRPLVEAPTPRPAQLDVPAEAARIKPPERKVEVAAPPKPKPPVN